MKKVLFLIPSLLFAFVMMAQPPQVEAVKGMTFGAKLSESKAMSTDEVSTYLQKERKGDVKVTGEVIEVCKAEGCWLRLKTGEGSMLVKMKDHAYLVPLSLVGKTVEVEGPGTLKETSVDMLKHYAEDAGKSKAEIDAITQPKKEVVVQAKGVVVI